MIYYTGIINNKAKVWKFQTNIQVMEFLEQYINHKDFDSIEEVSEEDYKVIYDLIYNK